MSKNLIIYYSRKGQNYWNGSIKNLDKGNTEIVAEIIMNGSMTQSKNLTAVQDLN